MERPEKWAKKEEPTQIFRSFRGVLAPICCSDWLNQMGLNKVISVQTQMMPPSRLSLDYSS